MEELYPEESGRLIELAVKFAHECGLSFPLPAIVREVAHPVPHWEVLAAPEGSERSCIMLDPRAQLLNAERRPSVVEAPKVPWWKKLLG